MYIHICMYIVAKHFLEVLQVCVEATDTVSMAKQKVRPHTSNEAS